MGTRSLGRARWWRRIVVATVVVAVASPAFTNRDSYPLSTYPVYATARDRGAVLATALGVTDDGIRRRLSLPVIADSDDPLIVEDRVADAIRAGRAGALCLTIAGRISAGEGADGTEIMAVEVVEEQVDVVDVATGDASSGDRIVHAHCPVGPQG